MKKNRSTKTQILKLVTLNLVLLLLIACSVKPSNLDPIPPATDPEKTVTATGPFTVSFDSETAIFEHHLRFPIDEAEGKVEYFITTEKDETIIAEVVSASTRGCDAKLVKHLVFWLPLESSSSMAQLISTQTQFKSYAKVRGKILHIFENLKGCTEIEIKTRLKKW